jgi:hypothetical protein
MRGIRQGGIMTLTATESEVMEAVKLLNDNGKWITLQQCLSLAKYEMYQSKEKQPNITYESQKENSFPSEETRQYLKKRKEGDLQLDGYILLGWKNGSKARKHPMTEEESKKYGFISELGIAAYLPITGTQRVYIWDTHARDAPHPDPMWKNKRWTHFVETGKKPLRKSLAKMRRHFYADAWSLCVPYWLLDTENDMRPLYLAGGKPE